MRTVDRLARLFLVAALVAAVAVVVTGDDPVATAATTQGCPAGTSDYFQQQVSNQGPTIGSPSGSAPGAIDLRFLGGHGQSHLYSWSVTAAADADVTRILLEQADGSRVTRSVTTPTRGTFTGGSEYRLVIFCLGAAPAPSLDFTKTSTSHPDGNGDHVADSPIATPGTITYRLAATNSGNVALSNVQISDPTPGVSITSCSPSLGSTLAAGATMTCTATQSVSIDRIAAGGSIVNTATASARYAGQTYTRQRSYTVPIAGGPAIEIDKSSTSNPPATPGGNVAAAPITSPTTVTYELTVTNAGNVALTDLSVSDPDLTGLTCDSGIPTFLVPGASFTCTGSQSVTQADIDAGGDIINTASASGRGGGHSVDDRDTYDIPIRQTVSIIASKTSTSHPDGDGDGSADLPAELDDEIDYVVTVQNTGNVDVTLVVTDSITTLTCGSIALAPGESTDCTGTYTVLQTDIDAFAPITNVATVVATGPGGTIDIQTPGYLVPVLDNSRLTVRKTSTSHPPAVLGGKVAEPGVAAAPGTVDFEIEIANTGTTTITGIEVADLHGVTCPGGTPFDLAPGASITCDSSVAVDQTDFETDPGLVDIAVAVGTDGGGNDVAGGDFFIVPFERRSSILLTKVAQAPYDTDADGDRIADTPITAPGDIDYLLVATNTGNVTLTDVEIVDPNIPGAISALTCGPVTLAPGESLGCDDTDGATITVDQADIDAGGDVFNLAEATGLDPDGVLVLDTSTWDVPIETNPDLTFTKVAQGMYGVDGDGDGVSDNPLTGPDTVDYTLTVENTGNVTISDITISDPLIPGLSCGTFTLAPGDSRVCDDADGASLVVDQARIDAGGDVVNTATAAGIDPSGDPVERTASWDIPIDTDPELTLTKTSSTNPDGNADGVADSPITGPATIDYELVATNTGNVTLTDVTIIDSLITTLSCGPVDLAPGASLACDSSNGASLVVSQADIDAGGPIRNVGLAAGTDPSGRSRLDTANYVVPISATPSIVLDKTPRAPYDADANGDRISDVSVSAPTTITYDLVATNNGNVTLTSVVVQDTALNGFSCDRTLPGVLAPGETLTCTGTYDITQADIDSRSDFRNVAAAQSAPQNVFNLSTWDIPIAGDTAITLTKSSTNLADDNGDGVADTPVDAPTTVDYELVAENTGTVTLDDVSISDPTLGALDCGSATPPVTLAPGETLTCTGSYEITQTDLDAARPVVNTATASATGEGPSGVTKSDDDSFTVPVAPSPAISIAKTGLSPFLDGDNDGVSDTPLTSPTTVNYQLVATNTGNVTLTDVVVDDPLLDAAGLVCTPTLPATLAPGFAVTCLGTYDVPQGVIDGGGDLINEGAVIANFGGRALTDRDTYDIPIEVNPELELVKEAQVPFADGDGNGISDVPLIVPQTVTYDLVATNTGNVTLPAVEIADPSLGALSCDATQPVDLAPGATLTCSADRSVIQAEVDSGAPVVNIAVATSGSTLLDTDGYVIPVQRIPGILVEKTSTSNPDSDGDGISETPIDAPGPVDYEITVTNSGNTTLTNVVIDDPMLSGCTAFAVGTLAPGASATCTDSFDVPQVLIDNGGDLVNTASAAGNSGGRLVLDRDSYDIPIDRNPSISVEKAAEAPFADSDGDGTADSAAVTDDVIDYVVTVTNDGNVTLDTLTPSDSLTTLTCAVVELAPGASTTCTGSYTVLQTDVDDLTPIQNIAFVAGTSPSGQVVTDGAAYLVPVLAEPDLVIRKSIPTNPDTNGDFIADTPLTGPATVDYEIVVGNGGTVSLTDVDVTDSLLPSITCPPGIPFDLAVGDAVTCTGSFVVTQAIFDAGVVPPGGADPVPGAINIARATATAPGDVPVAATWIAGIAFDQEPDLLLEKTSTSHPDGNGDGVADSPITGPTTITYQLVATNTGNVTLTDVTVTDPLLPSLSCGPTTLVPGGTLTCFGDLAVDQADIDGGGDVLNTATATGDFGGSTFSDRSTYDVPISADAVLELVKTSTSHPDGDSDGAADDPADSTGTITYRLTATNAGNTTLAQVEIDDPDLPPLTCTPSAPANLAPGASLVCTGSTPLTQADLDAGDDIVNVATATALSVTEGELTVDDPYTIELLQQPDVALTKSPAEQTFVIGEQVDVSWTVRVTNTGNVTLTDVAFADGLVDDTSGDVDLLDSCDLTGDDLAPGASTSVTCEVSRTIAEQEFANIAVVEAQSLAGPVSAGAVAVVRSQAAPPIVPPTTVPPTTTIPVTLPPTGGGGSVLPAALALLLAGVALVAITRRRRAA